MLRVDFDSPPQGGLRFFLAAEFDESKSQIVVGGSVVRQTLGGVLVGLLRFGDLAVVAQRVSQAVIGEPEFRIERQGVFVTGDRFDDSAVRTQGDAVIHGHSRIVGRQFDGALERVQRAVGTRQTLQNVALLAVRFGVVRFEPDRFLTRRCGRFQVILKVQRVRQTEVKIDGARRQDDRCAETHGGFIGRIDLQIGIAEVGVRQRGLWIQRDGGLEACDGILDAAQFPLHGAQINERIRIVRRQRERFAESFFGVLPTA